MKPRHASFALPGRATHHEPSHSQKAVVWNQSVMPMYLIAAPTTMRDVERIPVKRTPILSRMMPARIRKPQTLRMYSDAAYVPNTDPFHPLVFSMSDWRGDITSTNIYAKNIARAMRISAAHLAAKLSLMYFLIVCVIVFVFEFFALQRFVGPDKSLQR